MVARTSSSQTLKDDSEVSFRDGHDFGIAGISKVFWYEIAGFALVVAAVRMEPNAWGKKWSNPARIVGRQVQSIAKVVSKVVQTVIGILSQVASAVRPNVLSV